MIEKSSWPFVNNAKMQNMYFYLQSMARNIFNPIQTVAVSKANFLVWSIISFTHIYTANVCRDLQGLYGEIGLRGFQIYGDCMNTRNPCNF